MKLRAYIGVYISLLFGYAIFLVFKQFNSTNGSSKVLNNNNSWIMNEEVIRVLIILQILGYVSVLHDICVSINLNLTAHR